MLAGGHEVEVVDDLSSGSLANLADARRDAGHHLKIHQCDVRDNAFAQLVVRHRPDVVFHLATCTDRTDEMSAADSAAIDVVGTVRLLEAAPAAGVRKVVAAGSLRAGVSASVRWAVREHATRLVLGARDADGVECTVVDLPTVYGPRQQRGRRGLGGGDVRRSPGPRPALRRARHG